VAEREATAVVQDPEAPLVPGAEPQSVPETQRRSISIGMHSHSLRAKASLASNSYQEALASSLRSRGFSLE
jgi:hypothetical protein